MPEAYWAGASAARSSSLPEAMSASRVRAFRLELGKPLAEFPQFMIWEGRDRGLDSFQRRHDGPPSEVHPSRKGEKGPRWKTVSYAIRASQTRTRFDTLPLDHKRLMGNSTSGPGPRATSWPSSVTITDSRQLSSSACSSPPPSPHGVLHPEPRLRLITSQYRLFYDHLSPLDLLLLRLFEDLELWHIVCLA